MNINIPSYVEKIMNIINENNKEAYIVGGCVRDSLLGSIPQDWDVTTNMLPKELKKALSGYKIVNKNGEKHGTVTVISDKKEVEITTYRSDSNYPDGRHPEKIRFVTSLEEDLKRRDFTINALAYNKEKGLIDFVGGKKDIENKKIRCVGDPSKRFEEDYLRMLRALRFSSKLGFEIEKKDIEIMHLLKDKLDFISKERIKKELEGILTGKDVFKVLIEFKEIFGVIIPELLECFDFDQKSKYHKHDVYTHICHVVSNTKPDFITRTSALLHDIGKPLSYTEENNNGKIIRHFKGHVEVSADLTKIILKRLKFSNDETKQVLFLVSHHDDYIDENKKTIKRILNRIPSQSLELFNRLIDLKKADRLDHVIFKKEPDLEKIRLLALEIIEKNECLDVKDLKVNGNDMIELGFKGREIKFVLNELLNLVINGEVVNEKKALIEKAKTVK